MKTTGLLLVGLLLLGGCSTSTPTEELETGGPAQALRPAPDFAVTTITGEDVSMAAYRADDKPLMVYFTASWCPICAQNWPSLIEVYPEYQDRVNFVSISIDPTDTAEVLTNLAAEEGMNYPLVPGNPQVMMDFGVTSQATTVGINRAGDIVFVREREVIGADEYRALLDDLLADG